VPKRAQPRLTARPGDRTDAVAPQTGTAILVLAAFVLPGFVTVLLRERTYHARAGRDPLELLLTALVFSAVIYLTAAFAAALAGVSTEQVARAGRGEAPLTTYTALAMLGLVIGPMTVATVGKVWSDSNAKRRWVRRAGLDPTHAMRSAWDYWLAQRQPCLVRVTLDDGRLLGGFFGDRSTAGRHADRHDIFLEERWNLDDDGWFTGEPTAGTRGLYLPASAIVWLELYDYHGAHRPT
jgi:Family of unknown function (DUF6338)